MAGPGRGGRRRYVLVLLVMTSVTLITLDQRQGDSGPVGALGRFAHRVVAPVSDLGSSVLGPVSDWFDGVVHAGSLKHDNARLKRDLSAARIDALKGEQARRQNQILMKLDGQAFLDDIPSVVSRVVAQSPGNFERTVVLDHGTESGIKAGMPVVAGDGLVGRVVQAWSGGCNVLLLDDPQFGVGVRMVRERITGVAQGQAGRSTLIADFSGPLGPSQRPRVHELAETSGLQGSTFPPGIPVGTATAVSVSDDGLTIDVRFAPLVDVSSLEYVKVLRWSVGSPVPPSLQATTTTTTTTTRTTTTTSSTSSTAPSSTSSSTSSTTLKTGP
ncbi:MAG TPA: rod shape-determining protein MreC [Acidimicrobiia bacterium]